MLRKLNLSDLNLLKTTRDETHSACDKDVDKDSVVNCFSSRQISLNYVALRHSSQFVDSERTDRHKRLGSLPQRWPLKVLATGYISKVPRNKKDTTHCKVRVAASNDKTRRREMAAAPELVWRSESASIWPSFIATLYSTLVLRRIRHPVRYSIRAVHCECRTCTYRIIRKRWNGNHPRYPYYHLQGTKCKV